MDRQKVLKMDKIRKSRTLKKLKLMFVSSKRSRKVRSPMESCDLVEVNHGKTVDWINALICGLKLDFHARASEVYDFVV